MCTALDRPSDIRNLTPEDKGFEADEVLVLVDSGRLPVFHYGNVPILIN